jgi:phosphatidylserine decarboxylase
MARRIVSWRLPGDDLAAGQKLGMIRFGSRTDLLIPAPLAAALVKPGDVVRAGLTPLARYRS